MTISTDHHLVGLCRVSTNEQDTQLQRDALTEAGCARIFEEKISTRRAERPGLAAALDYLRPDGGDDLVVWRLDRLGRSVKEILTIAEDLHSRGIGLRILTGTLAGSYTPTGEGKFFFTVMAAFAELERDVIHQRTMAGLEAARRQGRVGGRPTVMDADKLAAARARRARGESPTQIAKALGVSRASIYRHLPPSNPDGEGQAVTDPPDQSSATMPAPADHDQGTGDVPGPAEASAAGADHDHPVRTGPAPRTRRAHAVPHAPVSADPPPATATAAAPALAGRVVGPSAELVGHGDPVDQGVEPARSSAAAEVVQPHAEAPAVRLHDGRRTVDLSAEVGAPAGTWRLIEAEPGSWHLHHDDARVGVVRREATLRGRRGWLARLDTGAPVPARGELAAAGSTLWRTRDLAAAAIARHVAPRKPRRR